MPTDRERWASQQIAIAIGLGINPLDAANAMREYLAKLPPGAALGSVLPASALEQDITTPQVIADARAAWYGNEDVPGTYKRLLDAGEQ